MNQADSGPVNEMEYVAALPVIPPAGRLDLDPEPRDIRNEPLTFAQPSVMSHQLPADRNVRGEELKLSDLLEGPVPTIEKHKINLKCWLFGKPSGNDLLRKTKQRRETIYYLRRFG